MIVLYLSSICLLIVLYFDWAFREPWRFFHRMSRCTFHRVLWESAWMDVTAGSEHRGAESTRAAVSSVLAALRR